MGSDWSVSPVRSMRTVLEDQYALQAPLNQTASWTLTATRPWPCVAALRKVSHAHSLSFSVFAARDTSYGALRTTLRCARISPVALPDLCGQAFGAPESPQSAPCHTRAAHFGF